MRTATANTTDAVGTSQGEAALRHTPSCGTDRTDHGGFGLRVGDGRFELDRAAGRSSGQCVTEHSSQCIRHSALGAQPKHVYDMVRLGESVLGGDRLRPALHGIRFDLNGESAVAADEVMVVLPRSAGAIEALAIERLEGISLPLDREVGERAVDGSETDRRTGLPERGM